MSWQTYVDNQICNYIDSKVAIIASIQDGTIWGKQEKSDTPVTQQELKVIADTMKHNSSSFEENGIYLGGEKYFCILAEPTMLRGRKGSSALSIVSTKSCLIVVVTVDGFPPGTLNTIVEGLAEYLVLNDS